jgi:hypothetical protein|tara:strand:+ start:1426 stop:1665 length:240 start_codon:yes stop_codon:yes gene_type:complete
MAINPSGVCIHCQPQLLDEIKELALKWSYSPIHGKDEIDVVVDDIPYEILDGTYQDPDVQLCEHYGINYDLVNCVEAIY